MTFRRALLRVYHYPTYWLSLAVFGGVGLVLNLGCTVLLLAPNRERRGPAVRRLIRRLFTAYRAWLQATRLIYVTWKGFTPEAMSGAAVYISNHPGLLDAPFLLSRLEDTICIFKPAIMRNPALGPAALMGGYVSGDSGVDLVRAAAERVADGHSLLIFPEGTRTAKDVPLNPLKPGFAVIAARAQAPVRLVVIHAPRDLMPKGWPLWRSPSFPAQVEIRLVGELDERPGESATERTARAARRLRAELEAA